MSENLDELEKRLEEFNLKINELKAEGDRLLNDVKKIEAQKIKFSTLEKNEE